MEIAVIKVASMKAESKLFKGISYVQVSELPQAQREAIKKTINPDLYIKLLIDGKIISGCLQYKDYTRWYQEHHPGDQVAPAREASVVPGVNVKPKLA